MNTTDIIIKLKNAVLAGKLMVQDVPINDLKECVRLEIETNRMTYTDDQFHQLSEEFQNFCSYVREGDTDEMKVLMFLEGMLICLASISQAVLSLANYDYWNYKHREQQDDPEVKEIIDFVGKNHRIRLLNYEFVNYYDVMDTEVGFDELCEMRYVIHNGRRMYFPKSMDESRVRKYYNEILAEQDDRSPHSYKMEGYEVESGDIIVDVGAAEGFWALEHFEDASEVYLFDADEEWIEALKKTFEGEEKKVHIYFGYVGDEFDGKQRITLDKMLEGVKVNYIKMDIEGYEKNALKGAERIIEEADDLRCAICTYHCRDDEKLIREFFSERGFQTKNSRGYMCPDWEVSGLLEAELRRGVLFGRK